MLEWEELSESEKQAIKLISESSLLGFQRCFFNISTGDKWSVNWHHKLMASEIEDIIDGKSGSTVFNVPPGAGKTEMLSIHAPVYSILKTKKVRNLNISFSDTLAKRNSRRTKDIIKSREFQYLWPHTMGVDQADEWQLLDFKRKPVAEVISRSIGGQITGGRGGYPGPGFSGWINLDDIDKPQDMFSDVKRHRVHDLLVNTLRSRRGNKSKTNPTPFVAIQQRLHVDDSTAFMLSGSMGIDFNHVIIPALITKEYIDNLPKWIREEAWNCVKDSDCINGYYSYWPENEDINDLFALWEKNEYTFMSQYMQDPITLGGNVFDINGFLRYGADCDYELPQLKYRFITGDTAQKTKSWNDFSVFVEWGVAESKLYALNMWRGKWEAPQLRSKLKEISSHCFNKNSIRLGNLRGIHIEDKSSGTGLIQDLRGELEVPIHAIQRNTDKLTRAMDTAPQIAMGKILIPGDLSTNNDWTLEFVAEHGLFTPDDTHKHDDIVDNTCDAVQIALLNNSSIARDLMFGAKK